MSDYLPDWLLLEILYMLPIESLLRFRCVSKQWCSLISSPHFISTYGSITSTSTPLFLISHFSLNHQNCSVYFDSCSKNKNVTLFKEFKFPLMTSSRYNFRVVGFSNGLFCLVDDVCLWRYDVILWNPALRKTITLPNIPISFASNHEFLIGFGFDNKTHDFKVVRITHLRDKYFYIKPVGVDVYKLSTSRWEPIKYSKGFFNCKLYIDNLSIYLNRTIHWLSYSKNEAGETTNNLLVFDLCDETFCEMGFPQQLAHVSSFDFSVTLCGEKISVISYERGHNSPSFHSCVVWVMNEYGKMESWMEKFVVNLRGGIRSAIGFTRNGDFLVVHEPRDLVSFDPESRGNDNSFFLSKYSESLALLNGYSGATSDPSIASESEEEKKEEKEEETRI